MTLTQSGYPVIPKYGDPRITKTSPVNAAPGVLDEMVPIFEWVMAQFDKTVATLIPSQCWGYAPRQIRGGTGWSNHASGTAIDLNATMFPQGQRRMTAAQVSACRAIVAQSGGAIRWGGDYGGSTAVDQQHFEIASVNAARLFMARLKAKPTQEDDDMKADDKIDLSDAYYPTLTPPRPAARKDVPYVKAFADLFNYTSTGVRDGKLALDQLVTISKQLDELPAKIAAAIAAGSKVTR